MEGEAKKNDLQSLLESIKSTEVVESRISLISQLEDSYQSETSDLILLVECLIVWTYWVDSACSDISQCMLNRTILLVAAKYLESDTSNCLSQFLILGTKASVWCGKHLQMTTLTIEESRDDKHSKIFSQLILDTLSFSSTIISALTRSLILGEKVVMLIIENFILELLSLTKASILENKKFHSIASEVLKVAQVVLDAAIKLCRAYFQAIRSDSYQLNISRNEGLFDDKRVDYTSHIISITACTIEHLYELGIFAASGGGSFVTVLNLSWKGVVCLLQLGKGVLAEKVNVGDVILTLVSLATESLRSAAEAWSTFMETLAISEAKRTFLPIKFYLINAVRICSEYPCEAMNVHREIIRCVLLISSLGMSLSKETHLKAASEALAELLEPTSFLLLHTFLNSADVKPESKFQILDWLFTNETDTVLTVLQEDVDMIAETSSSNAIFNVNCDAIPRSEALMLGRVILFLNLLKTSSALREEMVVEISRKLDYLLNSVMHECIYSSILGLQIPVLSGSGPTPGVVDWQPMFSFILHALKTFMIVASSSCLASIEVEAFLLQSLFHPHFLCVEIVRELWCFFIRHADADTASDILDKLCLLLKIIISSEPALTPLCAARKIARSICVLLTSAAPAIVDQVYNTILGDGESYLSSVMYIALLTEGFPLDSLSENLKTLATRKIVSAFYSYIESNSKELELYGSSGSCSPGLLGLPVHALASSLRSCQIKSCDIIEDKQIGQFLKLTFSLIHGYKTATDSVKDRYVKLLGAALDIISNMKHLYGAEELGDVILELQTLFVPASAYSDVLLYQCKPSLASFMAGLCHKEIAEGEGSALSSAIWGLYHGLLRERHWAFIHLALAAFGYFAARTSCTQLWRFVPHDAALSFDTTTGYEANDDRFMSELKRFLEKEMVLREVTPCEEQQGLLVKEGMTLKKLVEISNTTIQDVPGFESKISDTILDVSGVETVRIDGENNALKKKKRKLPDGIWDGMELLQNGLKTMSNAIAQADSVELKEAFSTHISCLEDVISHLVGLSGSV